MEGARAREGVVGSPRDLRDSEILNFWVGTLERAGGRAHGSEGRPKQSQGTFVLSLIGCLRNGLSS